MPLHALPILQVDLFMRIIAIFLIQGVLFSTASAGVSRSANEETGLVKWHLIEGDFEVELVQRLPDQTRGFFLARGFSRDIANEIATSCVFQTIIRNNGASGAGQPLAVDLGQWRMIQAGKESGIRLKEDWIRSWPEDKVSQASRLAFRWGTFPTQQEFLPGDYNWGMTAYGLRPGTEFDLRVVWEEGGSSRSGWIRDIECPPDVDTLK